MMTEPGSPGTASGPEVTKVRPGEELEWRHLVDYLSKALPELEGPFSVQQFPNGSANLTYLLHFGSQEVVLRRPPFGQIAPGAHDMRREYRVLSRLWKHYPFAPRALHLCTDPEVIGSDFVVMEYRRGEVLWGKLSPSMTALPNAARRVGRAVVTALAELHLVDADTAGLSDLGRPGGFVARQVEGWHKRWELVSPEAGSDLMAQVARQLAADLPAAQRVSILHNDFKLDNCQFRPGEPDRVNAVFDWDMATLGDPLVDLGTILNYWPDPADTPDDRPLTPQGMDQMGLPSRAEVVDQYAAATKLDVSGIGWYEAFACFKTAVVLQQLYARWVRGETRDPRMAERGASVGPMSRRAARILEGGTIR
jgi:aminoglycoside phosphotransferase (APT) family kinase protein